MANSDNNSNSTSNYRFVGDESQVREFYRKHIHPFTLDMEHDLRHIILPNARRKYFPGLSRGQVMVNSKIFSLHKIDEDRFVNLLRRYEVREGLYLDGTTPLPASAFAIYMTVEPMNELRAYFKMQQEINDKLQFLLEKQHGSISAFDIQSTYKSCLHKSPLMIFKKFDIDTKDTAKISKLNDLLHEHRIPPCIVVETKNGYHMTVRNADIPQQGHLALHKFCTHPENKDWIECEKNGLIVIPGTFQGGYLTRLVTEEWSRRKLIGL